MSAFRLSFQHFPRVAIGLMMTLTLAGCISYPKIATDWPGELPPVDLFVEAYENDLANQEVQSMEDYLLWVKRFYQGWVVYDNGWLKMSRNLAEQMPVNQRSLASQQIAEIGLKIAPEWAKEKTDRYIFTDMVVVWGEALLEALDRGEVFEYMDSVEQDLKLLKKGQVKRQDIFMQRYFPDIQEDSFLF
ncbi:MAG: hypothetical protein ACFHHU_06590 [Porticoccaceae bacterium]